MKFGWVVVFGFVVVVASCLFVQGFFSPLIFVSDGVDDFKVNLTLYKGGEEYAPPALLSRLSWSREYLGYLSRKNVPFDGALRKVYRSFSVDEGRIQKMLKEGGVTRVSLSYGGEEKDFVLPESNRGYIIQFTGEPVLAYKSHVEREGLSGLNVKASVASYGKTLSLKQKETVSEITESFPVAVGRRYRNVFNGISVNASYEDVKKITRLPNVKATYPIREYHALLYDSVPQIKADQVWLLNDSSGRNITGRNVTVAVIDTGVDYTHPDFGCEEPVSVISGEVINRTVESAHPYEDDFNETWTITQPGFTSIAVHFERVDVESGYDYVYIKHSNGTIARSFTGSYSDFWSVSIPGDTVKISLETDYVGTDWGFRIDQVLNGSVGTLWNCSKVSGGYDFVNNDANPMDDQGHGTHCAGIVAAKGNVTGVAPDATIVAYKVLNSEGSGTNEDIIAAIERAVDPNEDGDFSDHVDVISMSLGGGGDPFDDMAQAVDNAVDAGVVVVVAAGNSGPDSGTIDSPGCARKAITVGAAHKVNQSTGERNSSLYVVSEETLELPSLALKYSNTTPSSGLTGKLEYAGLGYPEDFIGKNVSGKIVLMERGELYFYEKVSNAYDAGASGAIIYNNFPGNFYGTLENYSAIPAVAISQENGTYLRDLLDNKTVEVNMSVIAYFPVIAEFSSRGPVYMYQKPDVLAPGVLICSSRWDDAFSDGEPCVDEHHIAISGTSMATPHVAGAVALLKQAHPTWSPLEIKAALEDTAKDLSLPLNDQGAGLIDVYSAAILSRAPPVAYISNLSSMEYV